MIKRLLIICCLFTGVIAINRYAYAQEVSIPDPNLASAILKTFNLPQTAPITQDLMQELTKLTAQRAQISDLTGLEHATNLTNLNLNSNQIRDINALSKLTQLKVLALGSNQITDISPLAGLTELQTLWLSSNQIQGISALIGLTQLENLFLGSNRISDISPLMDLTKLEYLSLFSNQIKDVSPLSELTQLEVLSLISNEISDLSSLTSLTNLSELYLNNNKISDLTPLAGLTQLNSLWLGFNQISALKPLRELTQLVELDLESNQIRFVSALRGLTELESLSLSSNQINSVISLQALPNLEELYIADNPISDIFQIHQLIAAGVEVDFETSVPHESQVALTRMVFNEIRNASDDKNDWIELKNISNRNISLAEWDLSILTRQGTEVEPEVSVVEFPDYTLPAGQILLVANTEPRENTLLRGQNIGTPNIRDGARHQYLVAERLKIPNTQYMLILRSEQDKNDTQEAIEDVAGTYFFDKLTADQPLAQGTAWQRATVQHVGYAVEAWRESGYQGGVGYQPKAPEATSPGTPGYPNSLLLNQKYTGQISISEVMFTNTIGNRTVPQWIELYNNSTTETVNLSDWKITIETREGKRHRNAILTFKDLRILPNQTVLLVSGTAAKSSNLPEGRIYNLIVRHPAEIVFTFGGNNVLSPDGFFLELSTPDGNVVDTVGNLDGDSETQDTPLWELPSGATENGARSSILRRYNRETRIPLIGTEAASWRSATEAKLGKSTYYGNQTDIGSPGYTPGGVLPVTLSSFNVERTDGGVVIKWTTESEIENAGFNILRSETTNGKFKVINPTMIQGAGTTGERNDYRWTDTTAKLNVVYYYRIEDVSYSGVHKQLATVRLRGLVSAKGKLTTHWAKMKIHD